MNRFKLITKWKRKEEGIGDEGDLLCYEVSFRSDIIYLYLHPLFLPGQSADSAHVRSKKDWNKIIFQTHVYYLTDATSDSTITRAIGIT